MQSKAAFARFARLFLELDGSSKTERHDVTEACVEALLDRIMNPPSFEAEDPLPEDADAAARIIIAMVERQADRVRQLINEEYPPCPDCRSSQNGDA